MWPPKHCPSPPKTNVLALRNIVIALLSNVLDQDLPAIMVYEICFMKTDAMAVSLGPIGALYVTTDPPARNPNTCVTTSASNHYLLNTAQVNKYGNVGNVGNVGNGDNG